MAAGVVATGVMSLVMLAGKRLGALGEPPPRRIMRRVTGVLGPLRPRGDALDVASLAAHFGFGASLGLLYGLLPERAQTAAGGSLFGLSVWATNYAGWLPRAELMPEPSRDRSGRPTTMVAAHWAFGNTLTRVYRALHRAQRAPLRGRVAVVCGGSRGLGRALARELLRQGASVAICGRDARSLEGTRAWLERSGGRVFAEVCDLRSELQTLEFFRDVERELGPADIVIANAASILVAPIETLSPADFDVAMREIFATATHAALTALPGMQRRGSGTIAFITSIGGKVGVPHLAPYSAAKFAAVGFAEALRAEVAKDGVRILSVFPGLMRTGSHTHAVFRGHPEHELGWFGAAAIAPLFSISAERAARRVVRALIDGDRRVTLTPAAALATALHDFMPGVWSTMAAIAGRLLPRAPAASLCDEESEGAELLAKSPSPILRAIDARTRQLAPRYGQ
ncbi:MAG TPA: SDR family oxidoreductase [Polyangiaceae bacterium]|nr:SDR family oxidoreductase [Polyangiaceae bacterium]